MFPSLVEVDKHHSGRATPTSSVQETGLLIAMKHLCAALLQKPLARQSCSGSFADLLMRRNQRHYREVSVRTSKLIQAATPGAGASSTSRKAFSSSLLSED